MTDREAIEILQEEHRYCLEPCYVMNAIERAISALQEREERSKGCEYCRDSKNIYQVKSELHDSMNEDVYVSGDALVVDIGCHSYGTAGIRFCPMCGRPLKTAMPGEEV